MKKRAIIATIVSFVLLIAVVAAGIAAVFTVTMVDSAFSVYSEAGREDAIEIRKRLDKFVGKSAVALKLDDLERIVTEYDGFRVESVEKKYPSTVKISIKERKETFAAISAGGFSVYDEQGCYLYEKTENINRIDGGNNVLLVGFAFQAQPREKLQGEYAEEFFSTVEVLEQLGEYRSNFLKFELFKAGSSANRTNDFFYLYTREGVVIKIKNPAGHTADKVSKALQRYLELSDRERVTGSINVTDNLLQEGEISVSYDGKNL